MKNELKHHGVKGMKWGVRHDYEPVGRKNSSSFDPNNDADRKESMRNTISKMENDAERKKRMKRIFVAAALTVGVGAGIAIAYRTGAISKLGTSMATTGKITMDDASKIMKETLNETKETVSTIPKQFFGNVENVGNDIIIKEGSELRRIAFGETGKNFDISKYKDSIYTTFRKDDAAAYKVFLKNHSAQSEINKYEVSLKALTDIKVPNEKRAAEIFKELWDNDPQYKKDLANAARNFYKEKGLGSISEGLSDNDVLTAISGGILNEHKVGSWAIVRQGETAAKKLVEKYKSYGYNGIIDYHDVSDQLAHQPLIVFNANKHLSVNEIKRVDDEDIRKSIEYLKKYGTNKIKTIIQ